MKSNRFLAGMAVLASVILVLAWLTGNLTPSHKHKRQPIKVSRVSAFYFHDGTSDSLFLGEFYQYIVDTLSPVSIDTLNDGTIQAKPVWHIDTLYGRIFKHTNGKDSAVLGWPKEWVSPNTLQSRRKK